jgi:hypothetical protein
MTMNNGTAAPNDFDLITIRGAFRTTGGTLRGVDVARLFEDQQRGDYISLARMIVAGEIFSFEWNDTFWLPMFQFARDLSIKPGLAPVLGEWAGVYEGWSLAFWFAQPNEWLDGARPVEQLDANPAGVLAAARADRFVATA